MKNKDKLGALGKTDRDELLFFFCWFYKNLALIIHLFSLEGGIFLNPSGFVFLPCPGLFNCRRESESFNKTYSVDLIPEVAILMKEKKQGDAF